MAARERESHQFYSRPISQYVVASTAVKVLHVTRADGLGEGFLLCNLYIDYVSS